MAAWKTQHWQSHGELRVRSKSWVTPEVDSDKREAGGCTRLFRNYAPQDNLLRYMLKNRETCWELPYLGKSYFVSTVSHHQTYLSKTLSSPKDNLQIPGLTFKALLSGPSTKLPKLPSHYCPPQSFKPLASWVDALTLLLSTSTVPISPFLCPPEMASQPLSRVYPSFVTRFTSPSLFKTPADHLHL